MRKGYCFSSWTLALPPRKNKAAVFGGIREEAFPGLDDAQFYPVFTGGLKQKTTWAFPGAVLEECQFLFHAIRLDSAEVPLPASRGRSPTEGGGRGLRLVVCPGPWESLGLDGRVCHGVDIIKRKNSLKRRHKSWFRRYYRHYCQRPTYLWHRWTGQRSNMPQG